MTNFKKLLRLNRLLPFEELSQEHQEILKDSNLKEEYDKIKFWTLPEEWYIKCTKESAPLLSEWREAGFVGYKANVLKSLDLDKIQFKGYGFQIEMKYKTWIKKFKLKEVPIIFTDRTLGESKISSDIIGEAVFGVISLRLRKIFGKL